MKKSEVLAHFGGTNATGNALGISKSTVSLWGELIPWQYALLISEVTDNAIIFNREDYPERFSNVVNSSSDI
ncbi:Cro/CI family transcriptional regulator [Serratia symbiotica]|uniref:Cro/CI family transcriptional regulator n=1 Tax=Serratia symbiotica TaxID=138074 RepID=UPI001CF069B4|nr:Cro/CI family transcriptional regulator [Serratia symbiotica]